MPTLPAPIVKADAAAARVIHGSPRLEQCTTAEVGLYLVASGRLPALSDLPFSQPEVELPELLGNARGRLGAGWGRVLSRDQAASEQRSDDQRLMRGVHEAHVRQSSAEIYASATSTS
jgi:hypothetical protein